MLLNYGIFPRAQIKKQDIVLFFSLFQDVLQQNGDVG